MRLRISHTTRYRFDDPPSYGLQQLRKTPKSNDFQSVIDWTTSIEGGKKELWFEDHHRNIVELISFERGTKELVLTSAGEVELVNSNGILGRHLGPSPLWLYQRMTPRTTAGPNVKDLLQGVTDGPALDRLHELSRLIREAATYEVGVSHPEWDAETVLSEGRGVCQDHTHVFLAAARTLEIPARYVSGYLMLNDRVTQEAMHAWAEAHVEGLGWVGFDVSNGISPDERYVRVATGLDYRDAAPVIGTQTGGSGESLSVEIEVAQQ